jgi:hypothetical protein
VPSNYVERAAASPARAPSSSSLGGGAYFGSPSGGSFDTLLVGASPRPPSGRDTGAAAAAPLAGTARTGAAFLGGGDSVRPAAGAGATEEFGALFASHEEWFRAAAAKRSEVYRTLQGEAAEVMRALQDGEARSAAVLGRINELDRLIDAEKARWGDRGVDAK